MKTGLVLEGGAMRGLFSAGVTDVLMENNINFDGLVGVSAGAAFGCNYKSGQIGRVARYNIKYCKDPRYCSLRSLVKTGNLFGESFCYHEIPDVLDLFNKKAFEENPMEFYVVCTDVNTGKPVYKKCEKVDDDFYEWMRASASIPLVSIVVKVGGYSLLDGGISDAIPLKFFESIGYGKNVVVLTQPRGYVKKKPIIMAYIKIAMKKYPKMAEAMRLRHEMYNRAKEYVFEREKSGDIVVICPERPLEICRIEHNPQKLHTAYMLGRKQAEKKISEIKEFIKN